MEVNTDQVQSETFPLPFLLFVFLLLPPRFTQPEAFSRHGEKISQGLPAKSAYSLQTRAS